MRRCSLPLDLPIAIGAPLGRWHGSLSRRASEQNRVGRSHSDTTMIAGIYGMNFEFIPELEWRYGYFGVLLTIGTVCYLLYRGFKRNGWL